MEEDFEVADLVMQYMTELGFDVRNLGYEYFKEAVLLCCEDKSYLKAITKKLYPKIAEIYCVSPSSVERAIRVSIRKAYSIGGLLGINDIYDSVIYNNDFIFSNSELIAVIVNKIDYDIRRKRILGKYVPKD